jgi:hypothetical protein
MMTFAPGMTAPVESVTVPEIVPRNSWAWAVLADQRPAQASRRMSPVHRLPKRVRDRRCGRTGMLAEVE